ncbi:hypothetical protein WN55_01766, partial [Dufourea novaeangliae]
DILPHLPYSADLAPSDLRSFRTLQNFLNGKSLKKAEQVIYRSEFFTKISEHFYSKGIFKLLKG